MFFLFILFIYLVIIMGVQTKDFKSRNFYIRLLDQGKISHMLAEKEKANNSSFRNNYIAFASFKPF